MFYLNEFYIESVCDIDVRGLALILQTKFVGSRAAPFERGRGDSTPWNTYKKQVIRQISLIELYYLI